MGWTPVTYACGHEDRVQIAGPVATRDARAARQYGDRMCAACQAAARAAETEQAAAEAVADHLPELQGSDKQVAWAQRIRAEAMAAVRAMSAPAGHEDAFGGLVARLREQSSAGAWIDGRPQDEQPEDVGPHWLLRMYWIAYGLPAPSDDRYGKWLAGPGRGLQAGVKGSNAFAQLAAAVGPTAFAVIPGVGRMLRPADYGHAVLYWASRSQDAAVRALFDEIRVRAEAASKT